MKTAMKRRKTFLLDFCCGFRTLERCWWFCVFLIRGEGTKKCLVSFLLLASCIKMQLWAPFPTPSPPPPPVWNFRSREYKRADEQWMLHPSSINLVSLPLLLLSLYMKVIMTPSSIILLSLLFSWNCLIICYRFVFTHIILPVICSISSYKHTAHFRWPFFEDYCQWHLQDAFRIWSIISVAMGNYTDLSVIAKSTTSNSVLMQR